MTARRSILCATVRDGDGERSITVRGQEARTLLALVEAGPRGITALECSTWAFRLAAYCHALRRDHGLTIRTDRETHHGGWHGRHVLESRVVIVNATPVGEAA